MADHADAMLAISGIKHYSAQALPLWPEVLELSRSPDTAVRLSAYEAACFMRPPKADFLELADRATQDTDAGARGAAIQWMVQRFPEAANQRGLGPIADEP